jgi:hypothetical protein
MQKRVRDCVQVLLADVSIEENLDPDACGLSCRNVPACVRSSPEAARIDADRRGSPELPASKRRLRCKVGNCRPYDAGSRFRLLQRASGVNLDEVDLRAMQLLYANTRLCAGTRIWTSPANVPGDGFQEYSWPFATQIPCTWPQTEPSRASIRAQSPHVLPPTTGLQAPLRRHYQIRCDLPLA